MLIPKIVSELKYLLSNEIKNNYSAQLSSKEFSLKAKNLLSCLRSEVESTDILELIDELSKDSSSYFLKNVNERKKVVKKFIGLVKKFDISEDIIHKKDKEEKEAVKKIKLDLGSPLNNISGIGPSRLKALSKLNLYKVADLLYFFPRYYIDRTQVKEIRSLETGKEQTISVKLVNWEKNYEKRGLIINKALFKDATGYIYGVWFNQPYLKKSIPINSTLLLSGKVERFGNQLQINSPEWEVLGDDKPLEHGRIVPVYHLTSGLSQRVIRSLIKNTLEVYSENLVDPLPLTLRNKHDLFDLKKALLEMHFPNNMFNQNKARYRLAFEELFRLQLKIQLRNKEIKESSALPLPASGKLLQPFLNNLPFTLTEDQIKCINDIKVDLSKPLPMNRLLHGEVGSGKTVVALAASMIAVENSVQVAFMAPTEVLALQHYEVIKSLIPESINCALLLGSTPAKEKRKMIEKIQSGNINLVIGTHALIQEDVNFHKLGLVIIDEQHRFGVFQRLKMKEKGVNPHMLVISATPIPRTLTLTLYGDLDISSLKNLPAERGKITTIWVGTESRDKVYNFLREKVKKGIQAYVVCPTIEDSPQLEVKAVTSLFNNLKNGLLSDLNLAMIHGRLPSKEVAKIMEDFKNNSIEVLISTSIIEVGVDVKNATFLVIEDAHRFGLSQLHQLRGRVRRSINDAYCFLISDPSTEEAIKRLQVITSTIDGFTIAEEDLKIRGSGEFLGLRQHGISELKVANPIQDLKILELAKSEAIELLKIDPSFTREENKFLKDYLLEDWENVDLIRV